MGIVRYGKNKKDYDDSYGEIYALYVLNDYQRQGIGLNLMKFAFKELKKNFHSILISTLVENTANEFYQKAGGILIGNSPFVLENNTYLENLYEFKID